MSDLSETWTYFNGAWHEGNVAMIGPRTHGLWLGSNWLRWNPKMRDYLVSIAPPHPMGDAR